MAINRRVALRKHEDDIKGWVAEGRSDGWIASALGTSASSVQSFRSRRKIRRGPDARAGRRPRMPREYRAYEGVLEQDPQGRRIGVWFDPAVRDDAFYEGKWRETRKVGVRLARDGIFLTNAER